INQMMAFFGQQMQRPIHRITALKAGSTTIAFQPPSGQGGSGFGGGAGGPPGGGQGGTGTGTGQGAGSTVGTPCKPDFQTLRAFGGFKGHHQAATYNLT